MPVVKWSPSAGDSPGHRATRLALARQATAQIAGLCAQRRACVQAGGHVGLWPLCLSEHFETVYTFEPDGENWRNLVRNATAANIFPARGVLGARPQGVQVTRTVPKSGHWYTVPGGPIPTYTIDGLGVPLDALVLDIEGDELRALAGAAETLRRDRPLVWCEARDRYALAAVHSCLTPYGYAHPHPGPKRDWYFQAAA